MRELKSDANGKSGAMTFTLTDISKSATGKTVRNQLGKLKVQKCAITWYAGYETGNNEFRVSWDAFIAFMKKHPRKKGEFCHGH